MAAQTATVFGGSGFVGRYVVRELAKAGARVRVAVRHPDSAGFVRTMGAVGQVTPVAANVRDDASVRAAVAGSESVVNLVGILYERGRQTFEAVHVAGAARIARESATAGVHRFVHFSALGADPASPAAYARSKAAGEAKVREAFPAATILRPSIVFGPEDDFFNRFAMLARLVPALPLIGGGHTQFQPVFVGDVAAAVLACLALSEAAGKTYELGGPKVYEFRELLALVLEQTGRRRLLAPLPFALAEFQAFFLEFLPVPPLTRDQVRMLRRDNVTSRGVPGLAELGITANALEAIVPTYLQRYRRGGGAAA
jgi:NADH dehydrogenase